MQFVVEASAVEDPPNLGGGEWNVPGQCIVDSPVIEGPLGFASYLPEDILAKGEKAMLYTC